MTNDGKCKMENGQDAARISDIRGKHDEIEFPQI